MTTTTTTTATTKSTLKKEKKPTAPRKKKEPVVPVDDGTIKFSLEQLEDTKKYGEGYMSKKPLTRLTPLSFYKLRTYEHAQRRVWHFRFPHPVGTPWVNVEVTDGKKSATHTVQVFSTVGDFPAMSCSCEDYTESMSGACLHTSACLRLIEEQDVVVSTVFKDLPYNIEDISGVVTHYNPVSARVVTFGGRRLSAAEKVDKNFQFETNSYVAYNSGKVLRGSKVIETFDKDLANLILTKPYFKGLLGPAIDLYNYQQDVFHKMIAAKRSICSMTMGAGKAQPLTSKILTPSGWKLMGNIKVGDMVVGSDGKPTMVTGVFPQGVKDVYRVTMTDNSTTECCDDHLWQLETPTQRYRGKGSHSVRALKDFKNRLREASGNSKWFIPMVGPVEYALETVQPIDPYLLGSLLGDGCFGKNSISFTTADEQMIEMLSPLLPPTVSFKAADRYGYRITSAERKNKLLDCVRELGLGGKRSWEKHIPVQYKLASVKERLALLQGLFDTDGNVSKTSVEYSTTSWQLAQDVREVVMSLGGTAKINSRTTTYSYKGVKKQGRVSYRLYICLPAGAQPFRLIRKLVAYTEKSKYFPHRAFKAVELIGQKECQCISIAAEDRLYVTDDFIVTHNTMTTIACYGWLLKHVTPDATMLIVGPKSLLTQWKREVERSVGTWAPVGVTVLDKPELIDRWFAGDKKLGQVGVIGYNMVSRHIEKMAARPYTAVVVDEVQFARNNETKLWSALDQLKSEYLFTLSGTVVENKLADLYSVMQIVDVRVLGPKWKFETDYHEINNITRTKIILGATKNMDLLREKLASRLFAYTKLKLPALTTTTHRVVNTTTEQELTDQYLHEAKKLLAQSLVKPLTFGQQAMLQAYLLKARQACSSSELITKSKIPHTPKKLQVFKQIIEDVCVKRGKKIVVFSEWTQMIDILQKETTKFGLQSVLYTGAQTSKARDAAVVKFQTDPNCKVFFASDAGGVGLDGLQFAASAVLHFELPWNPAKLDQRTGRVYRLGQNNPCECYYIVAKNSIEEGIELLLSNKRAIRAEVMQTGSGSSTGSLTNAMGQPTVGALKLAVAAANKGFGEEDEVKTSFTDSDNE